MTDNYDDKRNNDGPGATITEYMNVTGRFMVKSFISYYIIVLV